MQHSTIYLALIKALTQYSHDDVDNCQIAPNNMSLYDIFENAVQYYAEATNYTGPLNLSDPDDFDEYVRINILGYVPGANIFND